ncbi:AAA family ATPase [Thermovibrio sp.]
MNSQVESLVKLVKQREKGIKGKVLSFVSGKGGVGKTGIVASLAYSLANHFNKKVLLLDCDLGLGNLHLLLGLSPDKNLKAVFEGAQIEDVIQRAFNCDVVLGFSGIEKLGELEGYETVNLLIQLERVIDNYDYVLLDNSAGLNKYTIGFSRASWATYVITTPEPTALTDAYAFVKSLYKLYGYSNFKVVVNMVRSKREGFETFDRLLLSANRFLGLDLSLAGIVPYTGKFKEALLKRRPLVELYPNEPYSLEVKRIAQLETGQMVKEESSFIKRLFNFLLKGE